LLTSPLDSNSILHGKWLGAVLSMRRGWLWLGAVYGLTFFCGGVNIVGLVLVALAWVVFAGFVAMLGLWFSTVSVTLIRATVWTLLAALLAFGGHWLLWLCCFPVITGRASDSDDLLRYLAQFQLFALTPPATIAQLAFRAEELDSTRRFWNPAEHFAFAVIGLIIWAGLTAALWSAVRTRLRQVTMRSRFRVPERMTARPRRVPSVHAFPDDVLTVEEVGDE